MWATSLLRTVLRHRIPAFVFLLATVALVSVLTPAWADVGAVVALLVLPLAIDKLYRHDLELWTLTREVGETGLTPVTLDDHSGWRLVDVTVPRHRRWLETHHVAQAVRAVQAESGGRLSIRVSRPPRQSDLDARAPGLTQVRLTFPDGCYVHCLGDLDNQFVPMPPHADNVARILPRMRHVSVRAITRPSRPDPPRAFVPGRPG